jgi:hypothetical protein
MPRPTFILSLGGMLATGLALAGREGSPRASSTRGAPPAIAGELAIPPSLRPLLETHCLDCHDGARGKGGLDLAPALREGIVGEASLRALRRRLAKRDMPPADESARPTRDEYAAAVAAIDAVVAPTTREVPNVRRLNRAQHAGAVRDVLLVEDVSRSLLPPDEVGEGFDTTGDTLALPPLLVEKYFDVAEAIAAAAVPRDAPRTQVVPAERLERRGSGHVGDGLAWLATNGTLRASFEIARAGRHRIALDVAAQQAGDALARMALLVDDRVVLEEEIDADRAKPRRIAWEGELGAGAHAIGVRFLNDFWDPNAADPARRDRNLGVGAIAVEGPLDPPEPTAFERKVAAIAGDGADIIRLRRVADALGAELFRRTIAKGESESLASTARVAAGGRDAAWRDQLRALVTALLVDPRFLLRVEPADAAGGRRALTGDELASRLAFFLWSSVPDAALRAAARDGSLAEADGVAREARRMLADPRARTLATRFAVQWLGVDGLEARSVDPALFPGVDAALLVAMRRETERLFERVVAGELPVRMLLESRETEIDARLARHYGIERASSDDAAFTKVALPDGRPSGVLGHASVLLATSNPTRTSPVKRGRWVLDAMLDEAPPPPPPGVPQIPETREERKGLAMRELMAAHRANPDCASCHVQMDALGLAFERADVDGRMRDALDGAAIDDRTELPDGSVLAGIAGVERHLARHEGFERSLARRLLVYALGRGTADADDALVDRLASELRVHGDFASLVEGIVRSDAFRTRVDSPKSPPR